MSSAERAHGPNWVEFALILLALHFILVGFVTLALVEQGRILPRYITPLLVPGALALIGWGVLNWRLPAHDPLLFPLVVLLTGWGLIQVARLQETLLTRQVIWLCAGMTALLLVAAMPYRWYWLDRFRYLWLFGGLSLLVLTILWGVNPFGVGDRLWINLGVFYVQPSELLKILVIIFLASYLAEKRELLTLTQTRLGFLRLPPLPYLFPLLLMWGFSLVLLVWQQDLGAAMLFFATFLSMLYVTTEQKWYVILGVGLLILAVIGGYYLFDRVRLRGDIWLNPWTDPRGDAYQIVQSLLAFAGGGFFGSGIGLGHPTPYIPVVHSDMVFAAVGEEWGMLGAVGMILALLLLVTRGLRAAMCADTPFAALFAVGLSAMLGWQSLIILAGTLKLIPLTGITLPFVSYGGSSMLVSCIMVGLLIKISNREQKWQGAG